MIIHVDDNNQVALRVQSDDGVDIHAGDTINIASSDYERLENKPKIEGVELVGDVSLDDLGAAATADIPTKVSELENDSGYTDFSGDYNDLTNKPTIPVVPTDVSAFNNDAGYITGYTETDPVFTASDAAGITSTDISNWNGKSDFSGSYNDLTDKPTIPSDTKVEQMAKDPASWTYWRPLLIGYSSSATEGFSPIDQTNSAYAFKSLSAQPSTGTIRAGATDYYNGNYEAKVEADTLTADRTAKLPNKSGTVAMTSDIPTVPTDVSAFNNDAGYITGYTETDPTVPAWAKAENKPTYTASEVGALADDTKYAASKSVGGPAITSGGLHWGHVDSTSTATVFTAQIDGITEYYEGLTVVLRNGVVASTTNCTLNINGLGALPIYPSTSDTRVSTAWAKAYTMIFVYTENKIENTPCWEMQYGMAYSNSIGYQLRTNSQTLPLTDRCYRYRLLFTSPDNAHFVPANTSTSTNATASRTVNTTPIDPFGDIFYYGSTSALSASNKPSATVLWQQYVCTLGYSFNNTGAALTLTTNKPVYITATPNADGSAVLDYFTQDKPTTNDGKIYIYLGVAVSATTVEIDIKHPVYYHNGTGIRIWTGGA